MGDHYQQKTSALAELEQLSHDIENAIVHLKSLQSRYGELERILFIPSLPANSSILN